MYTSQLVVQQVANAISVRTYIYTSSVVVFMPHLTNGYVNPVEEARFLEHKRTLLVTCTTKYSYLVIEIKKS